MDVIEIADVELLPFTQWDETLGIRSFYASSPWLKVAADTADQEPFHLYVRSADTSPAATLPCYPMTADSPFVFCRINFLAERFLGHPESDAGERIGHALMPSLFLGGRYPAHTRIAVGRAVDDRDSSDQLAHALLARAERTARDRGLNSIGMLYVDDDDALTRRVLDERGYVAFPHYEAGVLDVPAGDFHDYTSRLSSRRANGIRRERKKLAGAGVRYELRTVTPETLAEVDRLEANLNRKYGTLDETAMRRMRKTIASLAGDATRIAFARIGDQAVGSVLLFRHADEIFVRTTGFDYELANGLPVYFGLMFYYLVEYAQSVGVRKIHYSTGSAKEKQSRGCEMVRQLAYVKAFDRELHARLTAVVADPRT